MFSAEQIDDMITNGDCIGQGIARTTYAINEHLVIKVPIYTNCDQTHVEIAFYERWEKEFSHMIPTMYAAVPYRNGKVVLFMERVVPIECSTIYDFLEECGYERWDNMIMEIEHFERMTHISDSSSNEDNWGIRKDGTIVLLDCGMIRNNRYDDYDYDYSYYNLKGE